MGTDKSSPASCIAWRLHNVWRTFPSGGRTVVALKNVTIDIIRGGITAIIGESGSGKTTLLQLLGGLDTPSGGTVYYGVPDVGFIDLADRTRIDLDQFRLSELGFVFQALNLISHLPVWRNVGLPLFLQGVSKQAIRKMALVCLDRFGIADLADKRPGQLSGGEQQRVAICRALIGQPRVILADEPTGNLDGENTDRFVALLKAISREEGISVIVVTHDLQRVASRCDNWFKCEKTAQGNVVVPGRLT